MFATALADIHSRASIENPTSSLSDPEDWVFDAFSGGKRSDSGVRVNRRSALGYSAVWRALNLISRDVAKIPLHVFKRLPEGGKERDTGHPAHRLLRRKANPEMKAFDLKQLIMSHVLLEGNAYVYVFRTNAGDPDRLLPLDPTMTFPVRIDGQLWYITKDVRTSPGGVAEDRRLKPDDVIHIKGLGFDGLLGYNVIDIAKDTLGLGLAMKKFGSVFFKNHAMPGVILEHPDKLSPEAKQELVDGWKRLLTGLDRSHSTTILEEGMKAHVLTVDARKAQLMEMRTFELREIANVLGVPPHKLGDTTRTSFSSLEQENQAYLDEALDPWLVQFEEECTDKLLTENEKDRDTHFIEFVREAIVRADLAARTSSQNARVLTGIVTRDEVRAQENMNPLPDGLGKITMRPANMILETDDEDGGPTGPPPESPAPEPEPADDDGDGERQRLREQAGAWRGVIDEVAARFFDRVAQQSERAAKRPDEFIDWVEAVPLKHGDSFSGAVMPVVRAVEASGGEGASARVQPAVASLLEEWSDGLLVAAECQPAALIGRVAMWRQANRPLAGKHLWDEIWSHVA